MDRISVQRRRLLAGFGASALTAPWVAFAQEKPAPQLEIAVPPSVPLRADEVIQ